MTHKALGDKPIVWHCYLCGKRGVAHPDPEKLLTAVKVASMQHDEVSPECKGYMHQYYKEEE